MVAATQPPDGEWLIDAEGRQYFIRKHPKHRAYKLLGNSRVRVIYGAEYDLAGEDAENIWLKVYRLDEKRCRNARPSIPGRRPAELAASAATFLAPIATVDRLQLGPFGAGLPEQGLWRNGFDLADIDGDGQIDFVHGPTRRGGDQPRIFLGDGHGTWRPYRVSVPPGLLDYGDVKVADFNGDGKADLAAGKSSSRRARSSSATARASSLPGGRDWISSFPRRATTDRVSRRGASRCSTGTRTASPISSP